jgi:mitochondrial fission protein ELM1
VELTQAVRLPVAEPHCDSDTVLLAVEVAEPVKEADRVAEELRVVLREPEAVLVTLLV